MKKGLVSVIMPAKDVANYVEEAVLSVIEQSYTNWELIIIVNGCTDNTLEIVKKFSDQRIRIIAVETDGLSHARNLGLEVFEGEFVCFLDADDKLPMRSLESRVNFFSEFPEITFVDGKVRTYNADWSRILREWVPDFKGIPQTEMALLAPRCFCGITWMIRTRPDMRLNFDESWTHLEDRVFFLRIAHFGKYDYVNEYTYLIRRRSGSLMANYTELEKAYQRFINGVRNLKLLSVAQMVDLQKRYHWLFFKTYLKQLWFFSSLKHLYLWSLQFFK